MKIENTVATAVAAGVAVIVEAAGVAVIVEAAGAAVTEDADFHYLASKIN